MNENVLRAIQRHNARAAIGSSSMRGAGSTGVVKAARQFLGDMNLAPFGAAKRKTFMAELDRNTERLQRALPKGAQRWGLARKAINIFLRNCLYTAYLRDRYGLARAERFFEVPLDSITGKRLHKAAPDLLPPWKTVRGLTKRTSAAYQEVASEQARKESVARVHLDAVWWGEREEED
jgi:hypothetical protein